MAGSTADRKRGKLRRLWQRALKKVSGTFPQGSRHLFQRALCGGLVVTLAVSSHGCTRRFYRDQADKEVADVLAEKDKYPQWKIENSHVYADPRARFSDPSNPDRPPMPPDDVAAYDLSPHPQHPGKDGVKRIEGTGYLEMLAAWDAANHAKKDDAEAPTPPAPAAPTPPDTPLAQKEDPNAVPGSPGRPFLITLEQAVELGLVNSREFQDRRENLYFTALPVTLQRFSFASQFVAAGQAIRQWSGRDTPEGKTNSWMLNSNTGLAKLFPTGALLLLDFANQTVINLGNPGQTFSQSSLNFDFIQPLLRGGGFAVTLEPLTQSERNLLYEIRSYARFRKEFFVSIAGGGGGSISGGVFVPTGVIAPVPYSPTGGIGISRVVPGITSQPNLTSASLQQIPGAAGNLILNQAIPAPVSGYLGTLLQFTQIDLDRKNVAKLDEFYHLFQELKEGGDVSQLQVDQIEQQILQGRTNLLNDQQQYEQAIDSFKVQLGMPVDLGLRLDGTPLEPLNRQFHRYEEVLAQYKAAGDEASKFKAADFAPKLRDELRRLFTTLPVVQGTTFRNTILGRWAVWEKLSKADDSKELREKLQNHILDRGKILDRQTELQTQGKDLSDAEQLQLRELDADIARGIFERSLRSYEEQKWKEVAAADRRARLQIAGFRGVVDSFVLVLAEARNERLQQLHGSWPDMPPLCVNGVDLLKAEVDEAQAVAAQVALENRLDLMNVRAQVVDAWRQIKVFANALLGVFTAQYHADTATPAGASEPFNFGGSRSRQEIILNGELPLVRKAERNAYRAAQIAYQRERRTLQEGEDLVANSVRGELRQLRVLAENYRIQQRQVELAYLTVESSLDQFNQPPQPTAVNAPAQDPAARAASLTAQLLSAQSKLPLAQNQLLTVWINYMNSRMQLYRDMELLPLNARGVWIDDVASFCNSAGTACPASDPLNGPAAEQPQWRPAQSLPPAANAPAR
jgi:hypothetical protein